uniref:MFS transporter n=1 Tax=Vaginimicrobium propionicum TaxID=1871034 RepID=UPI0009FA576A|nr:MFS transporter [Vaginimicrobium propionicum]
MRKMFSSLAIPNYRIWFIGTLTSNIGGWMARTAQAWLVLTILTNNSASALGILTAITFIPNLLFSPWGGSVADRFDKRRILLITMIAGTLTSLALGVLVIADVCKLWMVFVIAAIDGLAMTFDNPARQAMVSEIVPISQLPNAIALNSTSFNAARLLGPGLAGVLIAIIGTGQVILFNTLAFIIMITCLLKLKKDQIRTVRLAKGSGGVIEGFKYLRRNPQIIVVLACGFALGGLGFNFQISNAVVSTVMYGKGAGEFGALGSIMGVGALTAALLAARRANPRLRLVLIGMAGYTVFSIGAAIKTNYLTFALLQAPIGFFTITALVTGNTLVQTQASPAMRGRMLSLWNLTIMGVAPIVSPLIGWLGDTFGPEWTILFGVICVGLATVIITAVVMHQDRLRLVLDRSRKFPTIRILRNPPKPSDD